MASEDLLAYLKLEAEVFDDHTIHWSYRRNRRAGGLEKIETKWERTKYLGEGQFGQVWHERKCTQDNHEMVRAVKVIRKQRMRRFEVDYKKELLALATFSKPEYRQADALVAFLNWFEDRDHIFLAMEYFPLGDLATYISSISTEDEVRQITIDLLEGLKIIHNENFAHRDLKPQNIFVVEKPPQSPRWWVKIGDFGISKRVSNDETALRTQIGTPSFQAPEVHGIFDDKDGVSEYQYHNSVDVWSLGCVVYNISAKRLPFFRFPDIYNFCLRRSLFPKEPLSRTLSGTGIKFVEHLLVPEPTGRPSVHQALQDPWILDTSSLPANHHKTTVAKSEEYGEPSTSSLSKSQNRQSNPFSLKQPDDQGLNLSMQTMQIAGDEADRTMLPQALKPSPPGMFQTRPLDLSILDLDTKTVTKGSPLDSRISASQQPINTWWRRKPIPSAALSQSEVPAPQPSTTVAEALQAIELDWSHFEELKGAQDRASYDRITPDGAQILLRSEDGSARFWDIATAKDGLELSRKEDLAYAFAISSDGTLLATSYKDGTHLRDAVTGETQRTLWNHDSEVYVLNFSPDKKYLAGGMKFGEILIWTVDDGRLHRHLIDRDGMVCNVQFSPDSTLLATAGPMELWVRLWDMSTGKLRRKFINPVGEREVVLSMCFSRDGQLLAVGTSGGALLLWHVATGAINRELLEDKQGVRSLDFSPDGTMLAAGSWDKSIRLWNLTTNQVHSTLHGHEEEVTDVAFLPDGKRLLTASSYGRAKSIRLWTGVPRSA